MTEVPAFLDPILALPGFKAGWVSRIHQLPLQVGRCEAMRVLRPYHEAALEGLGGEHVEWWRAEQVHGGEVGVVPGAERIQASDGLPVVPGVDGLVTNQPGILLSVYVADCGVIWLADPKRRAVGLVHSGKKGTEAKILPRALEVMKEEYGTEPQDVIAVLGPCIRPPEYEIDFAADIGRQAREAGVGEFHDCGENTASDLGEYYSYRMEKGKTGRMMAMIGLE